MEGQSQLMGFAALKGDFLREEIQKLLRENNEAPPTNWQIQTDYHFGGFAKFDDRLIQFINTFRENHRIQLEPLYTGKLFFGIFDLIEKGWFAPGSRILAIHTGGLQGLEGFRERFGNII